MLLATIKKDKKTGLWYYRVPYKKPDGTHASKYKTEFNSKREAEINAIEQQKLLNDPSYLKEKEGATPFADYFENWVKIYKTGISSKTKKTMILVPKSYVSILG